MLTDIGAVPVTVPRDRNGSFEPKMVPKYARRLAGFNEQILSLYARGISVRDIRAHLGELYGVQVSPDLISKVTEAVSEEITAWQNRPWIRSGRSSTSTRCGVKIHRRCADLLLLTG